MSQGIEVVDAEWEDVAVMGRKGTTVEVRVPNVVLRHLRKWAVGCGLDVEGYIKEVLEVWVQEKGAHHGKELERGDPFEARRCRLCPVSHAREAELRRRLRLSRTGGAADGKLSILPAIEPKRRGPGGG
jgi:hypothetical protein